MGAGTWSANLHSTVPTKSTKWNCLLWEELIYKMGLFKPTYNKRWNPFYFLIFFAHAAAQFWMGTRKEAKEAITIHASKPAETTFWNNAKLVFQRVLREKRFPKRTLPCLHGSGCSLVSHAWEIEHMMAFREPVAHSWTSSWVTSAVCVMPPEVNFRDSASCRRGSGCCASTNSAKYLCKAQVLTYQAQINLEAFGLDNTLADRIHRIKSKHYTVICQ